MPKRATKRKNLFGWGKATRPANTTAAHGGIAARTGGRTAATRRTGSSTAQLGGVYKGYALKRTTDGDWYSSLDPSSWFDTKAQVQKHIDWYLKNRGNPGRKKSKGEKLLDHLPPIALASFTEKELENAERRYKAKRGKKNPAAAAVEAYENFHGHEPEETVTIKKRVHSHDNLAGAGLLKKLVVNGIDGRVHVIRGFKGALLCFAEDGNQLFIEGGDQSINLSDFGIKSPHEIETLGTVKHIDYFTRKDHLGDEGGEATYTHQFTTTNERGKHVRVRIARYPDLIYRVRDQQLEFSGGSYEIRAEGIDK